MHEVCMMRRWTTSFRVCTDSTTWCVQDLRQAMETQADELQIAVSANRGTERSLRRSDSSLQEAGEKIKVGCLPRPRAVCVLQFLHVAFCCLPCHAILPQIKAQLCLEHTG